MPEDAGKKRFIKDFLQQVKLGDSFIEDIWIERVVRHPGADGEGSTALSLSMRVISNITELLEDDLKRSFDERDFTFRFVAALFGSGKTSLLTYLHELTKTKPTYSSLSIVVRFPLSDLLMVGGEQSFSIKLYCHILAQTFWGLIHNQSLSSSVNNVAEGLLSDLLEKEQVSQLMSAKNFEIQFQPKFNKYLVESGVNFEGLFFQVISKVSAVEPFFTFVYLIDELDALQQFSSKIQDTRSLFKALIKKVHQQFKSKINLLMYVVGTSDNVKGFIASDSVLESILDNSVVNLSKGYSNEFEMIRAKIDERIEGAYKGYGNFVKAWQEIKNIPLNPVNNLRKFCQEYASAVLEIHERYFSEAPEQIFEGDARQLVEAKCRQQWASYLSKAGYNLSVVETTKVLMGHAFDCYIELLHNGNSVARAFGEAKNYELLSGHLQTFEQWLNDVKFEPLISDRTPPDLAFMIAPACPSLLQRKLELKKIQFILSKKVSETAVRVPKINVEISKSGGSKQNLEETSSSNLIVSKANTTDVNINTADKALLIKIFKGTKVKEATIDRLINRRPYVSLSVMASYLKFTDPVTKKLKAKLDNGDISF